MFQGILLVIVLSLDSFLASLAYAARQIHIPLKSAIVIAGISAGFLGLSFCCRHSCHPSSLPGSLHFAAASSLRL